MNACNQICFFFLNTIGLGLQGQSKKWNVEMFESHVIFFFFFFECFNFGRHFFFFFGTETKRIVPNLGVTFVGNKQKGVPSIREFFQVIWEFKKLCHGDYLLVGLDNLKHFSFLIQEKILSELNMCLWLAELQGGHYAWAIM